MQVELAYGRKGLAVEVPEGATVLWPRETPGLADEAGALRTALRQPLDGMPLGAMVRPEDRVVIVFSDITRPMPNHRVLPILLQELGHVPRERITLLNGLGTHRPNTPQELAGMLGAEIAEGYTVRQHDAWDEANLVDLGRTRYGHRAQVNRLYYEATCRICTGFIEPHLFAGFSGGPKAILPGVAGFETIMANHGYELLNDPLAIWGRTEDNPVWQEMREVAALAPPHFTLNVTLNRQRQLTGIYAGDLWAVHRRGVAAARAAAMVPVEAPFDIVLTSNSGYPLDINLYQAVKGMSVAAQIVKPGGSIIVAAECREGVPSYGEYRRLVHEGGSAQGIMHMVGQPGFRCHDQWEAQLQAQVMLKADVHLYSDGLADDEARGMLCQPCHDIAATLATLQARYGPRARICVLPEGPQTIPYVAA
jgi:lactate racemase